MAVEFGSESQVESSQRMYDGRAPTYEDSWHPDYSARFVKAIPLKPGDRVLDFCCGNGLEAFLAADIVGDEGDVVGVDISKGMLEQLLMRQRREPELGSRIKVFRNDVTNLDALSAQVAKGSFDVILCSNAFVLFDDPAKVVAHWREYLKPGGIMAVDITHEHNLRAGKVLELVARRLGVKFPSNRAWVTSQETFKELLEKEGLEVENVVLLEKVMGQEPSYYRVDQADEQYDYELLPNSWVAKETLTKSIADHKYLTANAITEDFKEKARPLFREEWANAAVDGKVEVADALYLYIARNPE